MFKEVLIILLSAIGFSISFYIWKKAVQSSQKLVCVIGDGGCDKVVKSKYSHIFGVDNSILGMLYFAFLIAASIIILVYPALLNLYWISMGRIAISGLSALFSIYLLFVQFAILKKWCEYCITSSALSIAIFLMIFFFN